MPATYNQCPGTNFRYLCVFLLSYFYDDARDTFPFYTAHVSGLPRSQTNVLPLLNRVGTTGLIAFVTTGQLENTIAYA